MRIGAVYPQIELRGDPAALAAVGCAVEALGYEHLTLYDHVAGAVRENRKPPLLGPYSEQDPFHDPFVAFGYLAGITQRIELVTGILILPQRQTLLVARQAADVDLLSGGRLRLGVGLGWNYVEYEALGEDFRRRGERLTEQIPYLRRLWSEPVVTFEGKFDKIDRAALVPRPKHMIPIWCGGMSEPAYRRAATFADGFIFVATVETGTIEQAAEALDRIRGFLREQGRNPEEFGADLLLQSKKRGEAGEPIADQVRRWRDAGGTHTSIASMGLGLTTADQHVDHFAEVLNALKAI